MFRDRDDAARRLAEPLKKLDLRDPVVLGVPRGGVVLAAVLARELDAECDIILVRKLRAPFQPELAIGAVSEDGDVHLNEEARAALSLDDQYLEQERQDRIRELEHRRKLFREVRPAAELTGRSVILTDDGIATGSTMKAAVDVVRHRQPHEIILAVPVAPPDRLEPFEQTCDRVVCLETSAAFMAISQFYDRFEQVNDGTVRNTLREFAPATYGLPPGASG